MKRNILVLLAVLSLVLAITGCTEQGSTLDPTKAFVGGTSGLKAYLIEGMPPPTISDANTFPFGVTVALENQGEADVGAGTDNPFVLVRLVGINPEQFGTTDQLINKVVAQDVPIRGAKRNFDGSIFPGELTTATFEPLQYSPDIHGNTQITIRADICYDYETMATAQICLKDEVLENLQDTSICSLTGEKNPQNSGGPLQITSVTEIPMSNNKIQVNFLIEHVGIGEFFGRPTSNQMDETCDFSVRNTNKYGVDVEVEELKDSGLKVTCSRLNGGRQGRITLFQGAPTTVSCVIERLRGSSGRIYQDLLNIRLKYRYGQFIETPMLIQDISN